jgi:L-lactate permease
MSLSLTFWNWLLAFSPLLVVIVCMLFFKMSGGWAGAFGWSAALIVSVLAFGAGFELLAVAQMKAVILSLDVLLIIWMALLYSMYPKRLARFA